MTKETPKNATAAAAPKGGAHPASPEAIKHHAEVTGMELSGDTQVGGERLAADPKQAPTNETGQPVPTQKGESQKRADVEKGETRGKTADRAHDDNANTDDHPVPWNSDSLVTGDVVLKGWRVHRTAADLIYVKGDGKPEVAFDKNQFWNEFGKLLDMLGEKHPS